MNTLYIKLDQDCLFPYPFQLIILPFIVLVRQYSIFVTDGVVI